jgi:hypothetical protein
MAESSVVDVIADNLVDKDIHSDFIIDEGLSSFVPTSKMLQFWHRLAVEGTVRIARSLELRSKITYHLFNFSCSLPFTTAFLAELGKYEDVDNFVAFAPRLVPQS